VRTTQAGRLRETTAPISRPFCDHRNGVILFRRAAVPCRSTHPQGSRRRDVEGLWCNLSTRMCHSDHIAGAGLILKQIPKHADRGREGHAMFRARKATSPAAAQEQLQRPPQLMLKLDRTRSSSRWATGNSPEADCFIYLPGKKKFLMAIGHLGGRFVCVMGLDLTMKCQDY